MALSNTQHIVLAAACQRPDRSIYPLTTKLPGGAAAKVLGSLLNKNLVKEVPAKRADTIWREDNKRGRLTLRATPDAFKALGVDEAPADTEAASSFEGKPELGGSRKASKSKPKAHGIRADRPQPSPEGVRLLHAFTLSYRDFEDLLAERGLMVSNESIRR